MTLPAETYSLTQLSVPAAQRQNAQSITAPDSIATLGGMQMAARLGRAFITRGADGLLAAHVVDPDRCVVNSNLNTVTQYLVRAGNNQG